MGRQAMHVCRRYLSSSAPRFNKQATTPLRLRCAQIFEASKLSADGSGALDNQQIRLQGHVKFLRKQKRWTFAHISDGSTVQPVQAILTPEQADTLTQGAAVEISGIWKPAPAGKKQSHDLQATSVKIVGAADPATYPIQKKFHTYDFLRQLPHLRLRTPFNSLLSRLRSEFIFESANVFRSQASYGFTQVQPPLITSSDCEGAGEVFKLAPREASVEGEPFDFFRSPKYLTVSSQLHLEAYAADLGNVWTLSPTFRAEKSDTPRHLSEFYMLEAEMNYMDSLDSLTKFVESFIRGLTERVYESPAARELFEFKMKDDPTKEPINIDLRARWLGLIEGGEWPRITYTKAIEILQSAAESKRAVFEFEPAWSEGLHLEHEKFLVDVVGKGVPVFVTDYPKSVKPFYMALSKTQPATGEETVACFDLLMPEICEVVGGSMREPNLQRLIQNMREHGLLSKPRSPTEESPMFAIHNSPYPFILPNEHLGHLQWYADLRRWGSAPHGGFGLGFDRFLGYLTGINSLRDVVSFPRYFGRADC